MQAVKNSVTNELRIWEKLLILVGDERDAGQYVARIEEIINGGILITNPEFVSGNTLLRNELPVIVQIFREDAAYQFHSRIRVKGTDTSRRFILTPPLGLQRVQRRMFARVSLSTRVEYALLPGGADWKDWGKNPSWCQTHTENISAGGILMVSHDDLRAGMLAVLRIPELHLADLPTDYLSVCRRAFSSENQRYAGLEFILVDELGRHLSKGALSKLPDKYKHFDRRTQDRFVNFLFHKQIELRQTGLI